jgi:hypothetical protein
VQLQNNATGIWLRVLPSRICLTRGAQSVTSNSFLKIVLVTYGSCA